MNLEFLINKIILLVGGHQWLHNSLIIIYLRDILRGFLILFILFFQSFLPMVIKKNTLETLHILETQPTVSAKLVPPSKSKKIGYILL